MTQQNAKKPRTALAAEDEAEIVGMRAPAVPLVLA